MTYPPGSPGYPPAQSSGSYGAPPAAPSFAKADEGESNLQHYLTIGVAVLGLASFVLSFGDFFTAPADDAQAAGVLAFLSNNGFGVAALLLSSLLAGVSLVPKSKNFAAIVAVVAVFGALEIIAVVTQKPPGLEIAWALWLILGLAVVQAAIAITALLLDAGVITPPAPRPKYDQYGHYGQYGYYGQQQAPYQQSGYGTQYGGYPSGPTTGGFSAQPGPQQSSPQSQQHGSPTPPTGFPSFSPPPSSGSGASGQGNSADHSGSSHGQHSYGQGQQPPTPSSPSGPSQS
ncbi:MAG: DUF5336 domain-containing protein [Mycobacterium sp.]